jgi:hypothetical protein
MLLRLAEALDIPMRERNVLLAAAGYAPIFSERSIEDAEFAAARKAIEVVLEAQKPYPAFALDRLWNIVASNGALPELYAGVAPELLRPPVNGMRLSLHPQGLAPRITNLRAWRGHLLARIRRQIDLTGDAALAELLRELSAYPAPFGREPACRIDENAVVMPLQIMSPVGRLSFFSTTTVFGTPVDVTLSEIAIELFFPADAATAEGVQRLGQGGYAAVAAE